MDTERPRPRAIRGLCIASSRREVRRVRASAAALAFLAAIACTEQQEPTSPVGKTEDGPSRSRTVLANLTCVASKVDRTVSCEPAEFKTMGGPGAPRADLIIGNQNVYVKVSSTFLGYDSGTGAFTFNADVRNLIPQRLGTTDGVTQDPEGIRVFFHNVPVATSGTGSISVVADGTATFTDVNQPYYQYLTMLDQFQVTAPKLWTLIVPSTVNTFTFGLLVAAEVKYPFGYIDVVGAPSIMYPGTQKQLAAVVRTAFGFVDGSAGPVGWNSGDPATANVDGSGLITAVHAGSVTLTAAESTSPFRMGTFLATVSGAMRTWTGTTSTDWSVITNWSSTPSASVPVPADSVTVPFPLTSGNFPVLVANTQIGQVVVADQATLSLGAFDLTASAGAATGYTAGSGILATTGRLILSGTAPAHGRFPQTVVTGVTTTDGNIIAVAPLTIDAGQLSADAFEIEIDAQ